LSKPSDGISIQRAFFNPHRDEEYLLYNKEKKKRLCSAFMVFYVEELREKLREIVILDCPGCNKPLGGKKVPKSGPHTCSDFSTLRQAYRLYGTFAMEKIRCDNEIRWLLCQRWWNYVFRLPKDSKINVKDAIRFSSEVNRENFYLFLCGWEEQFYNMMDRFSWNETDDDIIECILSELSN
jgi:hypothetical protein